MGECDFESGFCMYQDSGDEQSPWVIYDGYNNYDGVIEHDHTLGTADGHFLFHENWGPSQEGEEAVILGPWMTSDTSNCQLQLYYYLMDANIK